MAGRRDVAEVEKKDGPTVAVLTGSRQGWQVAAPT